MAELKKLPTNIFSTGRSPSIESLGKNAEAMGNVASKGFKLIGEVVKANNILEEKTLNSRATTDIEHIKLKYMNDPMLNINSIEDFKQEANAVISGYISQSNDAYAKSLYKSLEDVTQKYTTDLIGTAYKKSIENDRRDISLALTDLQKLYATNLSSNNLVEAEKNKSDMEEMLQAYYVRGGSAKSIKSISDTINKIGVATPFISELKKSQSEAERTRVMQQMMMLDNTPINAAAINDAWKEFTRLNKLYKESTNITGTINNAATGQSFKNYSLDTNTANESVKYVSNKIANSKLEQTENISEYDNYKILPSGLAEPEKKINTVLSQNEEAKFQDWYKKWSKKTNLNDNPDDPLHFYDYREAFLAKAEPKNDDGKYIWPEEFKKETHPNKSIDSIDSKIGIENKITNGIMKELEEPVQREPTLYDLAQAHSIIGAKNSNIFPNESTNRIMSGSGENALEAANAIDYVFENNNRVLELDPKTETVYTEFKLMRDSGRTDYDEMIKEARNSVLKISQTDLKINTDLFNSSYSMSGNSRNNLEKAFKEATGTKNADTKSMSDFYRTFRSKFILANGKESTALEMTKREMARIHGSDKFSPTSSDINQSFFRPIGEAAATLVPTAELFLGLKKSDYEYTRFPPSKIMTGLNETQIQNQFVEQIVMAAERIPNIKIAEHYKTIKDANDTDKMNKNFAFPAPDWSAEMGDINASIYITQNIPEIGDVEGRVFFKSNDLTAQNDSGKPVWEVWMQDRMGREHPVQDNSSPNNNVLLVVGTTAEEFAPEWAKLKSDEDIQKSVDKLLSDEGRALYPRLGTSNIAGFDIWTPTAIERNYRNRTAYKQELANQKLAEQNINRVMKGKKLNEVETIEEKQVEKPAKKLAEKSESNEKQSPKQAIKKASEISGVNENTLTKIAKKESGLNPNAKAKTSSASGLFQFTDAVWKEMIRRYGEKFNITEEMKNDAYANSIMGALLIKENSKGLKKKIGREPTDTEIYLAHFAGLSTAVKAINALEKNPSTPVEQVFSKSAIKANRTILHGTIKDAMDKLSKGIK